MVQSIFSHRTSKIVKVLVTLKNRILLLLKTACTLVSKSFIVRYFLLFKMTLLRVEFLYHVMKTLWREYIIRTDSTKLFLRSLRNTNVKYSYSSLFPMRTIFALLKLSTYYCFLLVRLKLAFQVFACGQWKRKNPKNPLNKLIVK